MAPTYTTSHSPSRVDGGASSWGAWLQGRWEMVLGILLCIAAAQAFEGGSPPGRWLPPRSASLLVLPVEPTSSPPAHCAVPGMC